MKRILPLIIFFCFGIHFCKAQAINKALTIGEILPTIPFRVESDSAVHYTSEWKGKTVVLDFWNVWCKSCIEAMPKLEAMQQKLKEDLQVVFLTSNSTEQVHKLFGKTKIGKPSLPFINNDTLFNSLFPHATVPHYVILDKNGKVLFITYGYNITESNLNGIIKGELPHLSLKEDLADFNPLESLLKEGGGRLLKNAKYYSFLLNRIDGFNGMRQQIYKDSLANKSGIKFINTPIVQLFKFAYGQGLFSEFQFDNRIIIESADSGRFRLPADPSLIDKWRSDNSFCYELGMPYSQDSYIFQKLRQDLENYFPYTATVEKRMVKCLVLEDTIKVLSTPGSSKNGVKTRQFEMNSFIARLNNIFSNSGAPIINHSGNIQVAIDPGLLVGTLSELVRQLPAFGYKLSAQVLELNMLVIKDKNSKDIVQY